MVGNNSRRTAVRNLTLLAAVAITVTAPLMASQSRTDDINYTEMLARESPRGVVRLVLADVAKRGLVGQHHYMVTFETGAPGVQISQSLREKFPPEMTIILQHRFENLVVKQEGFEVTLSFGGNPERIVVPFDAIKAFHDPSVNFSLSLKP
jgi:uncharacterized protein